MPASLLPALLVVSLASIWLSLIDLRSMRIPNRIVLPAIALALPLVAIAGLGSLARAALAALVSFLLFLVLNLASRGRLGMGDAKLAALLAVGLGAVSWGAYLLGLSLGFVFGGVAALVMLISSRGKNLHSSFAYGPYLTAGALVVVALVAVLA